MNFNSALIFFNFPDLVRNPYVKVQYCSSFQFLPKIADVIGYCVRRRTMTRPIIIWIIYINQCILHVLESLRISMISLSLIRICSFKSGLNVERFLVLLERSHKRDPSKKAVCWGDLELKMDKTERAHDRCSWCPHAWTYTLRSIVLIYVPSRPKLNMWLYQLRIWTCWPL